MSAGAFVLETYEASYAADTFHPIRVQPETLLATADGSANPGATEAVTNPISARVTGSRRSLGLFARMVRLKVQGTPPAGYSTNSIVTIPVLTETAFTAFRTVGTTITYLSASWVVIGSMPENVR
jgi:hypothetical protein